MIESTWVPVREKHTGKIATFTHDTAKWIAESCNRESQKSGEKWIAASRPSLGNAILMRNFNYWPKDKESSHDHP